MREWTVSVTWEAASPVTAADLERMLDVTDVVAGEPGQTRLESTLTVQAGDPGSAAAKAFTTVKKGIAGEFVSLEVMTTEEQDRRLAEPAFPELVGVTEIAKALGISRQRASALQKSEGFPAPVATLASGPIYRRSDLSRFEETWPRRKGRPPKSAPGLVEAAPYGSSTDSGRIVS